MKRHYEISRRAYKDLDEIWEFTAMRWSKGQANKYYKLLLKNIVQVCKNPQANKSMDFIKPGYRGKLVKSHIIVYKIHSEKVFIARVLHQRRDIESLL